MGRPAICKHFDDLPDPRVRGRCDHDLVDIIVISVLAVICGADGWQDIHEFASVRETWLRGFLTLSNGIPGVDNRRVFAALEPEAFHRCFLSWVQEAMQGSGSKLVAIDGKTARGSFAKEDDKKALHLVSAWCAVNNLVLGQIATRAKSNEITAIPELLELLDLRGATVTIDAMGCQTAIAEKIVDAGADYVLGLKGNHPTLSKEVRDFFALDQHNGCSETLHDTNETVDAGHGRIEVRRVTASDDIGWLEGSANWKGLKCIVMVESERTANEQTSMERRFYLSSLPADAALLGDRIRGHWGIENSLHWVLDMAFDEDRCRIRRRNAPDNFALLRKIAVNLLKREKTSKRGIEGKRKRAGWDPAYLLTVLDAATSTGG